MRGCDIFLPTSLLTTCDNVKIPIAIKNERLLHNIYTIHRKCESVIIFKIILRDSFFFCINLYKLFVRSFKIICSHYLHENVYIKRICFRKFLNKCTFVWKTEKYISKIYNHIAIIVVRFFIILYLVYGSTSKGATFNKLIYRINRITFIEHARAASGAVFTAPTSFSSSRSLNSSRHRQNPRYEWQPSWIPA